MTEVPHARKHHRYAVFISGRDDFLVPHGAAWLDYGSGSGCNGGKQTIREGEEGFGCNG